MLGPRSFRGSPTIDTTGKVGTVGEPIIHRTAPAATGVKLNAQVLRKRPMNYPVNLPSRWRQKLAIAKAFACGSALVFSGCRIPGVMLADAPPALPVNFNGATTPDSSAQLRVDEFFTDPQLLLLINDALAGNQDLKILAQDIRIADTEVLARRGAIFPFVTLGGRAGLERHSRYTLSGAVEDQLDYEPGKGFPRPLPNFLVSADLTWQVDIWRRLRNARDAASLRYLATTEGRNYVVTRLVAEVAENYYGLQAFDQRMAILDQTIALQEQSLEVAKKLKEAGRGTELGVQRFEAEVRRNQSEKLIVQQEIIETENRLNYLAGRFPQPVPRATAGFLELDLPAIRVGMPAELLRNRPDIRQAELDIQAAGLDVKVARAAFYPNLDITAGIGYEAFNPRYLFMPDAFVANAVAGLVAPVVNRTAIQAAFSAADARQLQALYNYQRVVLDAFREVVNRVSMAENYRKSIEIKRQQLKALETSVDVATKLFQSARAEYIEVLLAQRDMLEARTVLIETKRLQLSAVVNAYQALGGGGIPLPAFDAVLAPVQLQPAAPSSLEVLPPPREVRNPADGENLPPPKPAPAPGDNEPRPAAPGGDKPLPRPVVPAATQLPGV